MADYAAELFAHECCLSGEGKWDSGVCCCCHSFDANGCADAMCCAFAVPCSAWKSFTTQKKNWHHGDTCCEIKMNRPMPTICSIIICPCPWLATFFLAGNTREQLKEAVGIKNHSMKHELKIRPALPDRIVACCCLPWFPFLQ